MPAQGQILSHTGATAKKYEFADASWEVVGEPPSGDEFVPEGFSVMPRKAKKVDPLFADFGGSIETRESKRWHLPAHLSSESNRTVEKAEEAERLAAQHQAELEQAEQRGYNRGREEALVEAATGSQQKLRQIEEGFTKVLKDLNAQLREELQHTEQKAVQLSVDIARKIIEGAVEINPEYIVKIVHEALGLAGGAVVRKVRISPQDMEFIEVVGVQKQLKEYDGSWKFEGDAGIRSGCVVETSAGEIDYQLDSAWERVRDNIIKVVR